MVWVQVFPTGPTLISQSVTQFQDNWLFIQNNINTDHFFNTGAPTEGHHRFVQMQNQGGDPAVALDSVIYSKLNTTGRTEAYYRNNQGIRLLTSMSAGLTGTFVGPGTFTLFDCNNLEPFQGILFITNFGDDRNRGSGFVYYSGGAGGNARFDQYSVGQRVVSIQAAGTTITVTVSGAGNIDFFFSFLRNELGG